MNKNRYYVPFAELSGLFMVYYFCHQDRKIADDRMESAEKDA